MGRRIVEFEQGGADRAAYGQALLQRLSADLTAQFGRGFGADNLELMRLFCQSYGDSEISEAAIRKSGAPVPVSNSESQSGISRLSNWHNGLPSPGLTRSG
ncbi:DUF1016 N-terminal domain-containing protein [Paraburkholderia rhizosphaerae]|uniref:DUF1016 N-terminal domain-containing protein n=1 Tax=Paraburkholderia rhizosphaerae TaxID=480658 RepID=UPI0014170FAD